MTTDIQRFIKPEILEQWHAKFDRLVVRLAMKRRARELSNVGRLCRVWDAKVVEPAPGEIRDKLYGTAR